ncbi:MAG TPA: enoyl-CoA hydratase-related protein [Stellaceae bacterium]|nr:enoyl-CoA hydratase-related protein [Stellaceae bacterium]
MATDETLLTELVQPPLLRVTLNRPQAANAFNTQMAHALLALWSGLAADPGAVRCVVLTGAGDRAFCAGADLKERRGMSDADWQAQHAVFERQYWALLDVPVPVIAAVNGHAFAGGLETMLACDFAYAVPDARFALTEVTLGIMPGAGGTQFLPRAVGERRAKEIILTGRPFGAEEALQWGMVNRLVPREALMDEVMAAAAAICDNAPLAVRQAKKSIHTGLQLDLRSGFLFEIEAYNRLVPTADRREGIDAFNARRKPRFEGR